MANLGLLGGKTSAPFCQHVPHQVAIRAPRRCVCRSGNGTEGPEADELASSSRSAAVPDTLPLAGVDGDWRAFRARLVASSRAASAGSQTGTSLDQWAHSIPGPEKGALLLAHPMMFQRGSQTYFFRAVILLLDHQDKGSYGIILNRPSVYRLGQLELTHPLKEFNDCKLYVGGDVGGGEVHMLHTHGELQGCTEVVKGVYLGGIAAAQKAVADGKLDPQDLRWYAKYSGWGPGQLEREVKAGVWFTAAASPSVIMQQPLDSDGCDLWHTVLCLMGGDYQELSINLRAAEGERQTSSGGTSSD